MYVRIRMLKRGVFSIIMIEFKQNAPLQLLDTFGIVPISDSKRLQTFGREVAHPKGAQSQHTYTYIYIHIHTHTCIPYIHKCTYVHSAHILFTTSQIHVSCKKCNSDSKISSFLLFFSLFLYLSTVSRSTYLTTVAVLPRHRT